jgi:hypothetical protein
MQAAHFIQEDPAVCKLRDHLHEKIKRHGQKSIIPVFFIVSGHQQEQ